MNSKIFQSLFLLSFFPYGTSNEIDLLVKVHHSCDPRTEDADVKVYLINHIDTNRNMEYGYAQNCFHTGDGCILSGDVEYREFRAQERLRLHPDNAWWYLKGVQKCAAKPGMSAGRETVSHCAYLWHWNNLKPRVLVNVTLNFDEERYYYDGGTTPYRFYECSDWRGWTKD